MRYGPTSGVQLYFHSDCSACRVLLFRQDAAEADLERPALAEHLVDETAVADLQCFGVFRVGFVVEILAVPEVSPSPCAAAVEDRPDLLGERVVADLARHLLRRPQRGEIRDDVIAELGP